MTRYKSLKVGVIIAFLMLDVLLAAVSLGFAGTAGEPFSVGFTLVGLGTGLTALVGTARLIHALRVESRIQKGDR